MKNIKNTIGAVCIALFSFSCSDILNEEPRAIFEPGFFQTEQGVQAGLTALYAHTRYIFGGYFYAHSQNGTDEYTYGQQADNNFLTSDMSGRGNVTPDNSNNPANALWSAAFPNINTASGIIENAAAVGLSDALIAEARFWRAWDYFMLVQTFGGVPLDLGSGELRFNTTPSLTSVRNTVSEVYTRGIFPDLRLAIQHLPETGRVTGGLTKTAARLYLAKSYLTYAWWLENPNNIPTFPETPRVDPDGRDAAWYFQQAYNIALEGINNPGPFGLLDYFYDIHLGNNDRNREIVLYSDHIQDEFYNNASLSWSNGSAPESFAVWFVTWQSELIRSARTPGGEYNVQSVPRAAVQWGGRPWTRMAPPHEVFSNTFADKTNDSRFDGTFATVLWGNWRRAGDGAEVLYNANGLPVRDGEAVLTFLDEELPGITYPTGAGASGVGAGELPGRADWIIAPSAISRRVHPNLWKKGTFRTDNGNGLGQPNGALTRPWNIAKFSEFYFIAAEANVKGATAIAGNSARDLINVIRARAGEWRWHNNDNMVKIADNSAAMIAATPVVIDIYYILEERSREYFGEGKRWYDLVRTQTWSEIAKTYTISGVNMGDRTPETFTRTIQPFHYLRPIPQTQLDRMSMSEAEKRAYQNPGY
ncbi:MAG: RagB/SusD family nutrient uptake outer membrane protein [Dysgonamonadaceae bacterium]|jgi:hypothetical protein|nr:RagB/SusD family nutrient uptake outer membrane protein [Dysgonamonadaceae bacterium]